MYSVVFRSWSKLRIERISNSKIKVEIDRVDSKLWGVNLSNIKDNTPEIQKFYKYTLKQAEEKFNFFVGNSKVYIEAIPVELESFIIIISLGKNNVIENDDETVGVYKFADFEELISGIKEIYSLFYGKSYVYKSEDTIYLVLIPLDLFGFYETDNKLSEFSVKVSNQTVVSGMLKEYATLLFGDFAIETLLQYF